MKDFTLNVPSTGLFDYEEGVERPIRPHSAFKWNAPDGGNKLIVNFVGPNGAGKSVFPKLLHKLDPECYWVTSSESSQKIATIFPNIGWASVGFYRTKCGGCDSLVLNQIMESLFYLSNTNLHVVFEGSIVANTRGTYWEAMKSVSSSKRDRLPTFVIFNYAYETYLARIMARNGNQPIKEDMLQAKFKNIQRYLDYYRADGALPIHEEKTEGLCPMIVSVASYLRSLIPNHPDAVLDALSSLRLTS